MGTRAKITCYDDHQQKHAICSVYVQCDGYPSEIGPQLVKIAGLGQLMNGLTPGSSKTNDNGYFNGMGDFAAYMIMQMKAQAGTGHIYMTDNKDESYPDYIYRLGPSDASDDAQLRLCVVDYSKNLIYDGILADYDKEDSPEEDDDSSIPPSFNSPKS